MSDTLQTHAEQFQEMFLGVQTERDKTALENFTNEHIILISVVVREQLEIFLFDDMTIALLNHKDHSVSVKNEMPQHVKDVLVATNFPSFKPKVH